MAFEWLNSSLGDLADWLGVSTFLLNSMLAVVLLGTTCGMVGSTVVANRMAFFSDAMAHTAFAGISFALLQIILFTGSTNPLQTDPYLWMVQPIMVFIGVLAGVLMVYVRERTGLTNDTVIGVFFAFAIGLGSVFLPALQRLINYNPEQFLFGSVTLTRGEDLVFLGLLTLITGVVIAWRYNSLAIASFNPSLARMKSSVFLGSLSNVNSRCRVCNSVSRGVWPNRSNHGRVCATNVSYCSVLRACRPW